jgi:hypothetical protein
MQNNPTSQCPLCNGISSHFYQYKQQQYYQCSNCFGIFVDKKRLPGSETELLRYQKHNNNINDYRYQKFVSPITSAIMRDFTQNDTGLDFGAGTGPVISKILKDNSFNIKLYDPFFHNYPNLLEKQYDYIAACEVIEHFHNPKKEFSLLRNLLCQDGKLYCMTNVYNENIDFHTWDYKNDFTHVFIYHKNTILYIKEEFGFSDVTIKDRLITYSN